MHLPNLESVFAQLVEQQDTRRIAEQMVEAMHHGHA
jgi:ABC-2 type transport system ATP-binding protein